MAVACSRRLHTPDALRCPRRAEGCITVEKKSAAPKHHVLDIPNIHVMDALKSLKSKGFVTETFNWFVSRQQLRGGVRRRYVLAEATGGQSTRWHPVAATACCRRR